MRKAKTRGVSLTNEEVEYLIVNFGTLPRAVRVLMKYYSATVGKNSKLAEKIFKDEVLKKVS